MDRHLGLRISLTVVALALAVIAAFEDRIGVKVTAPVLGLLTIAALPWLASLLQSAEPSYFLNELRRLRSLGLIESARGKGVRMLERDGGDIGDYFTVTARGQEYLRLRAETKDSE